MSVLSGQELYCRIFGKQEDEKQRLIITPLLDVNSQIQRGSCSVDVRLGTHFIFQRRANVPYLDTGQQAIHSSPDLIEYRVVPFGKYMVLHPNQFALGGTFEYLKMPMDLAGYLVGRSSWGRLGLIVATAVGIHPGYKGIVTLELRNIGEVPFFLRPGRPIAQIFFHKVEGQMDSSGVQTSYMGAVVPEVSRLGRDQDLELIDFVGRRAPAKPPGAEDERGQD